MENTFQCYLPAECCVSGHLCPPGQQVSITESTVGWKAVLGTGPEGALMLTLFRPGVEMFLQDLEILSHCLA